MAAYIEPKVLKGFRDLLPAAEIARRDLLETIENSFRSYGFVPIDTPALEYAEILLGKGGGETEKQIYRFIDNGGRDVALHFDLTVPFARFMAEHRQELPLPFKRYHIAKVWRGENTQRGRYREFVQCDFDIVGSTSAAADFEILHIMRNTLLAISGGGVTVHLNHRGLFNRFLSRLGIFEKSVDILRTVDKLAKIGRDETLSQLSAFIDDKAAEVLAYIEAPGNFDEKLAFMNKAAGGGSEGSYCPEAERLRMLRQFMIETGIEDSFVLDPSITRGLDYYTGVVYESFINEFREIGSVCSGGRYDNLMGLYTKPNSGEPLSGVGSAIGIDRLIAALEHLGKIKPKLSYAKTAVACTGSGNAGQSQALAETLRKADIPCEVFLDEEKLTRQYQAAEKKGIRWLIIPDANGLTLRDLSKRESREGLTALEIIRTAKSGN